jgi:hypothetical protein
MDGFGSKSHGKFDFIWIEDAPALPEPMAKVAFF